MLAKAEHGGTLGPPLFRFPTVQLGDKARDANHRQHFCPNRVPEQRFCCSGVSRYRAWARRSAAFGFSEGWLTVPLVAVPHLPEVCDTIFGWATPADLVTCV